MFRGINPRELLDEVEEWHAMVIGFCEVLCPWHPNYYTIDPDLSHALSAEHHYYMFGRAMGMIAWLGIAVIVKRLLF